MTNEEVMQLMTDMGLHEGGMDDWVVDNAWVKFANAVASAERERITDAAIKAAEIAVDVAIAKEREACIVAIQWHIPRSGRHTPEYQMAMRMIERIRARGQA